MTDILRHQLPCQPSHSEGVPLLWPSAQTLIDILIDFNAGQETYLNFIGAYNILQDAFGKTKLDIVTLKGISPYIGKAILNEVEYV